MIVTIQHLRTVPAWNYKNGYCANKGREFFKRYGLDWKAFLDHGIEDEKLLATGNALAIHLVEYARSTQGTFNNEQLAKAVEDFKNGR